MADSWGQRPLVIPAVALAGALAASGYFLAVEDGSLAFSLLVPAMALLAAMTLVLAAHHSSTAVVSALVTVCIVVFIGGALFNASFLAGHSDGRDSIIFLLAVTFATDTGAYAVGRTIGSHKLAPSVSPGKTWEGAIGGLAAAIAVGAVLASVLGLGIAWIIRGRRHGNHRSGRGLICIQAEAPWRVSTTLGQYFPATAACSTAWTPSLST